MNRLSPIAAVTAELMITATLAVETRGQGFFEITKEIANFIARSGGGDGVVFVFIRHTSASLVIQENADPDVRTDLGAALDRLAPADAGWVPQPTNNRLPLFKKRPQEPSSAGRADAWTLAELKRRKVRLRSLARTLRRSPRYQPLHLSGQHRRRSCHDLERCAGNHPRCHPQNSAC